MTEQFYYYLIYSCNLSNLCQKLQEPISDTCGELSECECYSQSDYILDISMILGFNSHLTCNRLNNEYLAQSLSTFKCVWDGKENITIKFSFSGQDHSWPGVYDVLPIDFVHVSFRQSSCFDCISKHNLILLLHPSRLNLVRVWMADMMMEVKGTWVCYLPPRSSGPAWPLFCWTGPACPRAGCRAGRPHNSTWAGSLSHTLTICRWRYARGVLSQDQESNYYILLLVPILKHLKQFNVQWN